MSLDSIIKISVSTQSKPMAQAGFGTPIIIAEHEYLKQRVQSFGNLAELFNIKNADKEKGLPESAQFQKSALYRTASAIFSQNPTVPKIKVGKRLSDESITVALDEITKSDADGDFYGVLVVPKDPKKDFMDLSETIATRRLLAGIDLDDSTLQLAPILKESEGASRIYAFFKEDPDDYPAAACMGKMLPKSPGSATWANKELNGVKKSKFSSSKIEELEKNNVNRHVDINKVGFTMDGWVMAGQGIDDIHGIDWLQVRIQERLLRLQSINDKIPLTLKGVDLARCEVLAQLKEAVTRGFLAAEPEPYVSVPKIEDISFANRQKRILPDVYFRARLAGAIHKIEIHGTITI